MKMYKTYLLYESLHLPLLLYLFSQTAVCDLLPFPGGKLSQTDLINSFWLFVVSLFSSTNLKRLCASIFQELSEQ